MTITIIGSGNVGGALAQQWIKKGYNVLIGSQFPLSEKNIKLATQIGEDRFTTVANAVKQSEVILIATPPEVIGEIAGSWGDVSGKIIIDATNSIGKKPDPYPTVYHYLSDTCNAEVVKAFNTTGYENILDPFYNGEPIDMLMAGDSEKAKKTAEELALACGFGKCYDFGKGDKVELLEKFALSWINLAIIQGMGRDIAFRIVKR